MSIYWTFYTTVHFFNVPSSIIFFNRSSQKIGTCDNEIDSRILGVKLKDENFKMAPSGKETKWKARSCDPFEAPYEYFTNLKYKVNILTYYKILEHLITNWIHQI